MVSGKQKKTKSQEANLKNESQSSSGKGRKKTAKRSSKKSQLEEYFLMLVKAHNLPLPVREHKFHPTRKWRFDFAWPDEMVAVEIEGGIWVGGAHNRPKHFISDCEKYNNAVILGWRLLRFARDNMDIDMVKRLLYPQPVGFNVKRTI